MANIKACNSSGVPITSRTRLAVTLRWLAGGSYLDLCFAWGIGLSTFFSENGVLWPTLQAIDEVFKMGFPFDDEEKLEELSSGFSHHSGGVLNGCVMAMDGMGVITRAPFVNEVSRPKDYRYRKSGFGVIVLAGCDVKARFLSASCNHSGSTNDIIAWQDCNLYNLLEVEKVLPEKYFFIGDEAFSNTQQFLSPWPGRGLDPYKDSFNYWLSHSRQAIERAFGMLTQRFGIYWRMFRFSFDRWPLVIMVTMKIHNLCIDRCCDVPLHRFPQDILPGDTWGVHDNIRDDDDIHRDRAIGQRRRKITARLEQLGIRRPPHAAMNSRCN